MEAQDGSKVPRGGPMRNFVLKSKENCDLGEAKIMENLNGTLEKKTGPTPIKRLTSAVVVTCLRANVIFLLEC